MLIQRRATCRPASNLQLFEEIGEVSSPGFPIGYPAGVKCQYLLAGQTGERVQVHFPTFGTDNQTFLYIYDGIATGTPFAYLSGYVDPSTTYVSTTNVLKLVFQSFTNSLPGTRAGGPGFQAEFIAFNEATTVPPTWDYPTTTNTPPVFWNYTTSTGATGRYPPTTARTPFPNWQTTTARTPFPYFTTAKDTPRPFGTTAAPTFVRFGTTTAGTPFPYFTTAKDTPRPFGTTQQDSTQYPFFSTTGFPRSAACPPDQYFTNATIFSPNYPSPYTGSSSCNFFLQNIYGGRITVVFGAVETAKDVDFITVHDGGHAIYPQLGSHRAGEKVFRSSGSSMMFNFNAQSQNVMKGAWTVNVYMDAPKAL